MNHDEFMLKLEEESKKKNFRNWLNNMFPNGFAGYNVFYALTHPWEIVTYWSREVKYAWQRVFRGWDDTAPWSVDWYLAEQIPQIVKHLRKYYAGIPVSMWKDMVPLDENYHYSKEDDEKAEQKWCDILDKIIEGFESYAKLNDLYPGDEHYDEYLEKFNLGFDLLKEYFSNLWS